MPLHRLFRAVGLVAASIGASHATERVLPADAAWQRFAVDSFLATDAGTGWIDDADGSALSFAFSVASGAVGTLTVADGGFAGDTFAVTDFGSSLGATSAVPMRAYEGAASIGYDFDAALADPAYSRATFRLGAGSYRIGGRLLQSVTYQGAPLESTVGGIRLSVSAVPEPSSAASLLAGLFGIGLLIGRRR